MALECAAPPHLTRSYRAGGTGGHDPDHKCGPRGRARFGEPPIAPEGDQRAVKAAQDGPEASPRRPRGDSDARQPSQTSQEAIKMPSKGP